jgi:histidinol-phosphate aminotransferase
MIRVNENLKYIAEYKPSDRGGNLSFSKLDWNECNLKIDKKILKKIFKSLNNINLTEYPNIDNESLLLKLSNYCNVNKNSIQIFNGSDSALHYIFATFLNKDTKVLVFYPNYSQIESFISLYSNHLNFSNIDNVFDDYSYNFDDIDDNEVIYFSNPNNPTGIHLSTDIIEVLLKKYPNKLFIVDEAYYEFAGETCVNLVESYDNLIVTRTFSKAFSMASIRLGYICTNVNNIKNINKIRNTKEVNSFAQYIGEFLLDHINLIKKRVKKIKKNKEFLMVGLDCLKIEYINSKSNFILIKHPKKDLFVGELSKERILVRDRSMYYNLDGCVRITIGSRSEMKKIINILKNIN